MTTSKRGNASKEARQNEALERMGKYAKLSPKDKIAKLDRELGKGVGATKQRATLKAEMKD